MLLFQGGQWIKVASAEKEFVLRSAEGQQRPISKSVTLAAKSIARLFIHLPSSIGLARSLAADCYRPLLDNNAGIFLKHLRKGYACGLNSRDRAEIVAYHYRVVVEHLGPDFLKHSLGGEGVVIWRENGDPDGPRIVAKTTNQYDFESELTLRFMLGPDVLYIMGCVVSSGRIWRLENRSLLVVTRVQGIRTTLPKLKLATVMCGDCAPRILLFSAIEGLAATMKIHRILGVGVKRQIATAFGPISSPSFVDNYDGFWQSLGGKLRPDGNYIIPTPISQRPLDSLASKHRARAERRRVYRNIVTSAVASRFV